MALSYEYSIGSVRAKEKSLFNSADIEQLLASPDVPHLCAVLNDKATIKSEFNATSSILSELEKHGSNYTKSEADLDYAISAFDRAYSSISKVSTIFSQNCMTFAGNWAQVIDILDQGDNSRKTEGNGLGLALVKRIVDLCNGKLGVANVKEGGVCFTVELPYVIADMM